MSEKEKFLEQCLIDELNTGTLQQKLQYETGRMTGLILGGVFGFILGYLLHKYGWLL